jgi:hypothetical protein
MNPVSSIIRIITGLVLIILSYVTYQKNSAHIDAGEPAKALGFEIGLSGSQLTIAFTVIGFIGLGLVIFGVVGFLKGRR